jgi:transposase-like protein
MKNPKTLQEAITYFADPDRAFAYAVNWRWQGGAVTCPRCGSDQHSFIKTRRRWFCKGCKKQFTVKVGTIFEDSPIGLDKWMTAMWAIVNCKNGVSSYELGRMIGVTQKSAWFMSHRIRVALQQDTKLTFGSEGSPVEVDETFIGGKARNMHKSKRLRMKVREGNHAKTIVMGMLERGGQVKATVLADRKAKVVQPIIREHVSKGAQVLTDEYMGYRGLADEYAHEIINHLEGYVRGHVHTNGIENYWSLLKRGLNGTYVAVEPFHLFRYVDEQAFRFNNRATKDNPLNDSDRFVLALSQVAGKRLTFAELTGKTGSQAIN